MRSHKLGDLGVGFFFCRRPSSTLPPVRTADEPLRCLAPARTELRLELLYAIAAGAHATLEATEARARARRDLTVPIFASVVAAISSYDWPRSSRRMSV